MASDRVVAPLFLVRFQQKGGVVFHAWSPRPYGPIYSFQEVQEDDPHPMMNREYMDALQRVMMEVQQSSDPFVDLTTDIHSPVPVEQRGEQVFFVTLRDSLFSPIFFLEEEAERYIQYVRNGLLEWREGLAIRSATHRLV
jgi:hypothetical protein